MEVNNGGSPTPSEMRAAMKLLTKDEHTNAMELIYGVRPGDPKFEDAVRHAMKHGLIVRSDRKKWGSDDEPSDVLWERDDATKNLTELNLTDTDDQPAELEQPYIWYGPNERGRLSDLDVLHGKGKIRLEWWRVKELSITGVRSEAENPSDEATLNGDVVLADGRIQSVILKDGVIVGNTALGIYRVRMRDARKLVPRTGRHDIRESFK